MSAVATAVQPVEVVLNPTREYPRELRVELNKYGGYWVGVVTGKRHAIVAAVMTSKKDDIDITEFARSGSISLCVHSVQFRISRDEADRLAAAFGFEVKKL